MSRPRQRKKPIDEECNPWFVLLGILTSVLLVIWLYQTQFSSRGVNCRVPWKTLRHKNETPAVCLTSLSDAYVDSEYRRNAKRDFKDVLESTWDNKQQYCTKHGYRLFNASHLVDPSRPPAWSKIRAVLDAMKQGCEWVFWVDPDSLIMNSRIRIEDLLPAEPNADLVITKDVTGFNAGMWILHTSPRSEKFLTEWWSMESYVLPPGATKSGDNDALKVYLEGMSMEDKRHVYIAPQCAMNSYVWVWNLKSILRYFWISKIVQQGLYAPGHFIAHFAGIDNKMYYIKIFESKAL